MMTVNPAASRRFSVLHFTTWLFVLACLGIANFGWRASSAASPVPRQDADTQPPTVVLRSPVDGEVIRSGLIFTVVWQSTDNVRVDQQNISFSSDDGVTFDLSIAANLDGTVTQFEWRVPSTLRTTRGRVRVEAVDGAGNRGNATSGRVSVTGSSDQLPPSVAIISPDGADTSKSIFPNDGKANDAPSVSKPIKIEWTAVDETALASFDIAATLVPKTGQTTTFPLVIATGLAGDRRSFDWIPGPTVVSETVSLRITARDTSGNTGESITRTPFAIRNRPVIKALEYFCSTVFIYGDNFTSRTLVNLNNKNLSPFKDLIELQPTPTPGDPRGSQVLRVQSKKQRGKRGRFDDAIGAPNTVFVSDVGIFSAPFSTVGDGPRPPRIQFKTPAGDSLFKSGDEINISWEVINDDKCPVRQQELSFAQGNRGFDEECGLTGADRRDLQIAVLDGSVRNFTWKVPIFFPGFGRLRLKATSVEGTGEAIIGTGNPRNEPTSVKFTDPGNNGQIVASEKDNPGISWTYVGACNPESFRISFRSSFGTRSLSVAGTVSTIDEPLPKSFSDLLINTGGAPIVGSLTIETVGGLEPAEDTVEDVSLVAQPVDGGEDAVIQNIKVSVQGVTFPEDRVNLAFGETLDIDWDLARNSPPISTFTITFNGTRIQPLTEPVTDTKASWIIPVNNPAFLSPDFRVGTLTVEARDQAGALIGQGSKFGITIFPAAVAVVSPSSGMVLTKGNRFSISGSIRQSPLVGGRVIRVTYDPFDTSADSVVLVNNGSLDNNRFTLQATIPTSTPVGSGRLVIELLDIGGNRVVGTDILQIQVR